MSGLSSQALEFVNRSAVLPIFVKDRFMPYVPEWDEGIDFIVYREKDDLLLKLQLKSRWSIDRKYVGRNIGLLFRDKNIWYLCPHDDMVEYAHQNTSFLSSESWIARGIYHVPNVSLTARQHFETYGLSDQNSNEAVYSRFRIA
jgi:hypothetical protein